MKRWLASLVLVMGGMAVSLLPEAAHAATFPVNFFGYFDSSYDACGTQVYPGGISATDATTFENTVLGYLGSRYNGTNYQTGSEFIILTMEGFPAGTPRSTAYNSAVQTQWKADVNYYAAQGWINWSLTVNYTVNTFDQAGAPSFCSQWDGSNHQDIATEPSGGTQPAIVFQNPNGSFYEIKRNCGNPLGTFSALQHAPSGGTIQGVKVIPGVGNVPVGGAYSRLDSTSDGGANPFYYNNVSTGNHTLYMSLPAGSNLQYLGYSWCDNGNPQYNGQPSCYYYPFVPGELDGTGTSFTINVQNGHTYDVRLWYKQNVDAAVCVGMTAPATMTPSTTYQASVTMKNSGNQTWTASQTYNLGSDSPRDNSTWAPLAAIAPSSGGNGVNRAAHVNTTVGPGGQITFTFSFKSPASLGNYTFAWAMVRDGQYWMDTTPNSICSQSIKVQPPPPPHRFWAASLITAPVEYVRDNFQYAYKLFTYFWPDAGDRRIGTDLSKNMWLSGIWGVASGDIVASDSNTKAAPNSMTSINTVAEKNCPTGVYGLCLERVPMAYVPQDDGSGVANSPGVKDGSQTPNGNNWMGIKNYADGGSAATNPDLGLSWDPYKGGIASYRGDSVDGATGTVIKNVEISNVHAVAIGIADDSNGNDSASQGGITASKLQPDSQDQALDLPGNPTPTAACTTSCGSQGPRNASGLAIPGWDNLTFNSEAGLASNQTFNVCSGATVSSLPEFTCDPYNMLGNYASLVQYLTQDTVTSKLQDGQDGYDAGSHHQYPNPSEPMTYTNAATSAQDVRLQWNEYDNWTQVDDKGHYYTNRGVEAIGYDFGPQTSQQVSYDSVSNAGYQQCTGTYDPDANSEGSETSSDNEAAEQVCNSWTSCTTVNSGWHYTTSSYDYYEGSYQTQFGWLNSSSVITGFAPYGSQGNTAASYFYDTRGYPVSYNPTWATNNAGNMWQDPSVTSMSAAGATTPPSLANPGQWTLDTSDPVYNNRYVFDHQTPTPSENTGWAYDTTCVYPNGSYSPTSSTAYFYTPSNGRYLYESSNVNAGDLYFGQYNVTYDGSKDNTVDTGWSWASNIRRVQYEQTFTGHYRDFGPRSWTGSGDDSELYGLSSNGTLAPDSLARGEAVISNPLVSLGTASNDIFGAAGISSYFNTSGCSPGCPSSFLYSNGQFMGFSPSSTLYPNYCLNPDNIKVNAYYPTNQGSPTNCNSDTNTNAVDYIFQNYANMKASKNQTLAPGSTLSGQFQLNGGIFYDPGDLHLNNVQFCTNGNTYNNANNISDQGGGTIIVEGNLYIDGPVSYQTTTCGGGSIGSASQLPSVGFIVGEPNPNNTTDGIIVGPNVQNIVGSYFTNGSFAVCSKVNPAVDGAGNTLPCQPGSATSNGNVSTTDLPFSLSGLVVADQFSLNRQVANGSQSQSPTANYCQNGVCSNTGGSTTEAFNYDGRVIVVPPPGFSSVLRQPATYSEAVPLN